MKAELADFSGELETLYYSDANNWQRLISIEVHLPPKKLGNT